MAVPLLNLAAEYQALRGAIDAAIGRVIERTAFVGGEELRGFEAEFAAACGTPYAIGVANGSDAIELALQALGVGHGDAVLTVPFTFAATVEAIVRSGATPLLVDIGDDFTLDIDAAAAVLAARKVKAIIAVHLYGHTARPVSSTAGDSASGRWAMSGVSASTQPRIWARWAMPGRWSANARTWLSACA